MRVLPVVLMLGCGRLGFQEHLVAGDGSAGGDGKISDGTGIDVAPPACTNFGAFAAPAKLSVQTASDDWDPTPTRGGLELFWYACSGTGNCDLMHATRAALGDAFGAPQPVTELSTPTFNELGPTLTADGLTLIYASDESGSFHLRTASRGDATQPFGAPVLLANVNAGIGVLDRDPFVSADGLRLVFLSTRGMGGTSHLYEATRATLQDAFSAPVMHGELAVTGEISPTLSADGLEIIFSSQGGGGPGGFDLFRATRTATDQPFSAPILVAELDTLKDELGARLSEDGATLYFNWSTVIAGGANAELYSATRGCQ